MKLHVDLESLELIEGPGFRNPVTSLRFKRGDAATLEVSFLAGGLTHALIGDSQLLEIHFGAKSRNEYGTGYLVHTSDWTMPDQQAETPTYLCSPSFNTEELNTALGVGTENELSEIILMGEITWHEGVGLPTSTRTFLIVVENDVNRGTEGIPTSLQNPGMPYEVGFINGNFQFDRANGVLQRAYLDGDITVLPPSNSFSGARLQLWLTPSGTEQAIGFDPTILIPSESSITLPKLLAVNKLYIVQLQHNGLAWMLTSLVGGY